MVSLFKPFKNMAAVPTTMRAVLLTGHGGPEKLEYRTDVPVPAPGVGEVLIRVHAAGVNNTDINTRRGWYSKTVEGADDGTWTGEPLAWPRVQGADVCGVIAAVGSGVPASRIGERVLVDPCMYERGGEMLSSACYLGSECDGGFAEFLSVASRHAHLVTSSLTSVELASFPCSYSTADNLPTRAGRPCS